MMMASSLGLSQNTLTKIFRSPIFHFHYIRQNSTPPHASQSPLLIVPLVVEPHVRFVCMHARCVGSAGHIELPRLHTYVACLATSTLHIRHYLFLCSLNVMLTIVHAYIHTQASWKETLLLRFAENGQCYPHDGIKLFDVPSRSSISAPETASTEEERKPEPSSTGLATLFLLSSAAGMAWLLLLHGRW